MIRYAPDPKVSFFNKEEAGPGAGFFLVFSAYKDRIGWLI